MRKGNILTLFFLGVLFLTSCGKDSKHTKLIPASANMVATINVGDIKSKNTDLDAIMNHFTGEVNENTQRIINSGIDLSDKVYIFSNINMTDKSYYGGLFLIDDIEKFEAAIKNEFQKDIEIIEEGEIKMIKQSEGTLGWSDKIATFVSTDKNPDMASEMIKGILSGSEGNSLLETNEKFKKSLKRDTDVIYWVDLEQVGTNMSAMRNDFAIITDEINLKDTYLEGGIDFDDGEVISETTFFGNDDTKEFTQLFKKDVSSSLVKTAAGENLIGAMSIGLDFEKIIAFLEKKGYKANVDQSIAMSGMTTNDIKEMLTGDIVLSLNGIQSVVSGVTGEERPTGANFTGLIGLKNKEKATGLVGMFGAMMGFQEIEEGKGIFTNGEYSIKITDDALIIAGTGEFAQKAMDEKAGSLGDAGVVGDNPINFYLDYTKLPEFMKEELLKESPMASEIEMVKASLTQNGADFTSESVVKLKNKDKNSFSVLMKKAVEAKEAM